MNEYYYRYQNEVERVLLYDINEAIVKIYVANYCLDSEERNTDLFLIIPPDVKPSQLLIDCIHIWFFNHREQKTKRTLYFVEFDDPVIEENNWTLLWTRQKRSSEVPEEEKGPNRIKPGVMYENPRYM